MGGIAIALDWVEGERVHKLIRSIERLPGPRRTRLLAVAFCDRVAHLLPDDASRESIEVARRYADKKARQTDMAKAHDVALRAYDRTCVSSARPRGLTGAAHLALRAVLWTLHPTQRYYAQVVANDAAEAADDAANEGAEVGVREPHPTAIAAESAVQLWLIRDVLGRPDNLPTAEFQDWPVWHGGLVPKLARGIYEDRAFEQMPILGDALKDAGCTREDMLAHCRGPGPHTRGCWVVDLLTGRE